jgi:ADP-dependent NAD(P)H-hydrate dehydratase / NAD(P)H-hydrate epimerase
MWIADASRIREIDRLATEEHGIPAQVLMERAGTAVFEAVRDLLHDRGRLTVFCGKGNNGGDGFVVARLAKVAGYEVDCIVAAEAECCLSPEACEQFKTLVEVGVRPVFYGDRAWDRKSECLCSRDLIVDALLGTGASGEIKGPVREAIQAINRSGVPVVAVDVPSGIKCDTGEELTESVWAVRTVTFGHAKPFLFQGIGLEHAGYWTVADIGYPRELLDEATEALLVDPEWVANLLPERLRASHKGENGSVLIVAGSRRMRGAAVLAAKSALRAGAGMITVAGIDSVCEAIASQIPEALLMPLPEDDGVISPDAAKVIFEKKRSYQAGLFGPGMTHEEPVKEFLSRIWQDWELPALIDADALNAVSQGVELPKGDCVLTPHPGEMSRLLRCSIAEVQSDRFATVREAVGQFGKTILLKGPYSIVGEDGQPLHVNCTGNPGMASGGMGDVLSGVIATLLGQDLPGYYAASCGMFWHGLAGDLCATEIGPIGYGASDVADALPKARAKIVATCDE